MRRLGRLAIAMIVAYDAGMHLAEIYYRFIYAPRRLDV